MRRWYAAVGTDGRREVVWGLGATPAAALTDAHEWLADDELEILEIHQVTAKQAACIEEGDVSWPPEAAEARP